MEEAYFSGCSAEPVATGQTPQMDTRLIILPYEQVNLTATFSSELERYPEGVSIEIRKIQNFIPRILTEIVFIQLPIQTNSNTTDFFKL